MGTCNYITQSDFDLYIYDENLDETLDENEAVANYDFSMMYAYKEAERLAGELSSILMFHNIKIKSGYYTGIQTYVESYCNDIEQLDNEDCQYYYNMCRSKTIRKYNAEVNRINKKFLPLFKKELGFDRIICVGVFSNGEAIYERIK